jgi:hypothetical protein
VIMIMTAKTNDRSQPPFRDCRRTCSFVAPMQQSADTQKRRSLLTRSSTSPISLVHPIDMKQPSPSPPPKWSQCLFFNSIETTSTAQKRSNNYRTTINTTININTINNINNNNERLPLLRCLSLPSAHAAGRCFQPLLLLHARRSTTSCSSKEE